MATNCYAVIIDGQKPRFYTRLSTAKRVAAWHRNPANIQGHKQLDPVVKEFILFKAVED